MEKTRKFLIATHGTFSAGAKSSLDMIIGAVPYVFIIQAYLDEKVNVEQQIQEVLEQVSDQDELVIFSDIMGGSVTNQLLQHALKPNIHILSGFNLPLLIDVMLADQDTPVNEVIRSAIENAKEQMVYVNELLTSENND
jgi:fructoselysine and glucoselysine-specific PTS system IIA component